MQNSHRPLSNIAHEIRREWKKVNFAALPYLNAMMHMDQVSDRYMYDDGRTIVIYFLANAKGWRGTIAKAYKAELKALLA